jgi:hypothetical protein
MHISKIDLLEAGMDDFAPNDHGNAPPVIQVVPTPPGNRLEI